MHSLSETLNKSGITPSIFAVIVDRVGEKRNNSISVRLVGSRKCFMNTKSILVSLSITAILVVSFITGYWIWEDNWSKPLELVSVSRVDHVFAKQLKAASQRVGLLSLRDMRLDGDDHEIRIWRWPNRSLQEAVFIKIEHGNFSGLHVRYERSSRDGVEWAEKIPLTPQSLSWNDLWAELQRKGLFSLALQPEIDCGRGRHYLDGIVYFVEIGSNGTYRNYTYAEGIEDCQESRQMTEIGKIIGTAFHDGKVECKADEWFPCVTINTETIKPSSE